MKLCPPFALAAVVIMVGDPIPTIGQTTPPMPSGSWAPAASDSITPRSGRATLHLDDLLDLVAERNPRLHAVQAYAVAAATRVDEASTLPDPMLQLGVMNFGLPDFNTDMPNSMAPSVQVMQMVPFPGKLSLKGDIAESAEGMAGASANEAWWDVRGRAAVLFYELYSLDRRIEVMRETLALLRDFQTVAKAMYSAGTGRQADVLRADVEVARMDGDIRTMEAMRTAMAARLNGVVDRPAETVVASPSLSRLPLEVPARDTLVRWAEETRPLLSRARLGVEQADARVDLAGKQIWPDLSFGVTYGQRDAGMGTQRMGSAMIGFSLPVHAGKRQLAARDEARAMQRMAESELGGARAEVGARIGELLAELDRARSLVGLYEGEVLPEARATVESALSSYRVGAVDFMTLVDAQMTVNRYEGEHYQLLADYGKAVAALESTVGRTLPETDRILAEALEDR
jgi:cobalt-zinc-cadmium efflux system outer membrane protein